MKSPYKYRIGGETANRRRPVAPLILVGLVGAALLGACGGSSLEMGQAARPAEPTAEAAPDTVAQQVDPAAGAALLDQGAVLIDVRTPQEYGEAHIDGALLIDISAPDFVEQLGELDPAATYVVYCRSGNRSRAAVEVMAQLGFSEVYDMGGIQQWIAEGRPVVSA